MNKWYLNSKLPYPKHKGKTLKEVIDTDISYIKWLHHSGFIDWEIGAWEYFLDRSGRLGGFKSVKRA